MQPALKVTMGCGASARQTAVSDDGGLPMKEVESWGHDQVLQEYCKDGGATALLFT